MHTKLKWRIIAMKKILATLAVIACCAATASYGFIQEDWQSYTAGSQATFATTPANWGALGTEMADAYILADASSQGNFVRIFMKDAADQVGAIFATGLIQKTEFNPLIDISSWPLEFMMRSNYTSATNKLLALSITAETIADSVVRGFRTSNAAMQSIPLDSVNWTKMTFNPSDLYVDGDTSIGWAVPDLTAVQKIELVVLQVNGTLPQVDDGYIDVDSVPEPGAMLLFGFAGVLGYIKKRIGKN